MRCNAESGSSAEYLGKHLSVTHHFMGYERNTFDAFILATCLAAVLLLYVSHNVLLSFLVVKHTVLLPLRKHKL